VQVAQYVETKGEALFALAIEQDFEGVVGKRSDSLYRAGPDPAWQKFRNREYSRKAALGFRR
jgi:ATP-dependent DNA ligase